MGDAGTLPAQKRSITSAEHEELLDIIDKIRSQGISRYIDLPQIVVCGDQSSGKSSCLEAICGLRFPTGDGLCTRFATEYILRRCSDSSVSISIVPDTERIDSEKFKLQSFQPSTTDLDCFPEIIEEVARCMGIGQNGKTFAHDVLRIEISGPTQGHLTLVDLPGLFHSSSKSHTDGDKDAVFSLVASYIARPRSIILAVVSAKNDLNNQAVLNFAREHDPTGVRTLGIITKPHTLSSNSPSEQAYLEIAKNNDVKFDLGWHVLRNRSWEEQASTADERDRTEQSFFESGTWRALDVKNKGISTLRVRLSKILYNHILSELPSLLKDVEAGLTECSERLETLGSSRGTVEEQRMYLLRASQKFVSLMTAAFDGTYHDSFFGSSVSVEGYQKRLRAVSVAILKDFAEDMRLKGHAVELVDKLPSKYKHEARTPRKTTRDDFYDQVQFRMRRNGGRELPGLFNPSIVGDLFSDQAKPWSRIVAGTKDALLEAAHTCVGLVLDQAADEATIDGILHEIVNPGMESLERSLSDKVEEVLTLNLKRHPFTLNHYFTENIQRKRVEQTRKDMGNRLHEFLGVSPEAEDAKDRRYEGSFDVRQLLNALVKQTESNMDRFAAIECVNAMLSYYKVSFKTLIDAFGIYAVEACLLSKIPSVFTPETVLKLDDSAVQAIAGESQESLTERESLTKKLLILKDTQKILHRLDRHKGNRMATCKQPRDPSPATPEGGSDDESDSRTSGDSHC
ncbi:uncharacterized protein HMPREF1541_10671 [Cyphellophora europaea CBS 101466]|uniref:GED domain-containing protein n=1 Tax=Cyphellophora europaea (strain CBS 101466) TaxID=1220924 RepID=W2S5Y1_CYPE1|nr:uncharacterized protein HMPREF1541_10671 [Cyphellophora europaea CBS 101466]ETN44121.1 hypothetical protein HMPREF1541_10671 [Cyphellophora europaea CBS 101466]